MKYPIKLIGVGSPEINDQIGWQIIKALQSAPQLQTYFDHYLETHQSDRPGIRLLNYLKNTDLAFLFDAVKGGEHYGQVVHCEDIGIYSQTGLLSTHGFGIADALRLGNVLKCNPRKVIFYGVVVDGTKNESCSIESAIKNVVDMVCIELRVYLQSTIA